MSITAPKLPTWDEPCVRLPDGSYAWASLEWLEGNCGEPREAEREAFADAVAARVLAALHAHTLAQPSTPAPPVQPTPEVVTDAEIAALLDECGYVLVE